jgi:signal transduction histidine kinase
VHADRNAILQCLLNVFDNARKYAAASGRLEVDVITDDTRCAVAVRDHGPGIAAAERSLVFERFERGARHRDGSTPGVGLGLYLARSIARGHDGELDARSPDDGGAGVVFWLELPAQPLHDAGAAAESSREQSA